MSMNALTQLTNLMAEGHLTQGPSEMRSLSDRMKLMSQSAGISTLTTIQNEEEIPPPSSSSTDDEVHILPIDDTVGIPPMNWYAELLGRLGALKLDPDPKNVTKQITDVMRSLRTMEGTLVFPSLAHEMQALDVCYLLLKQEETNDDPTIQPVPSDEVSISEDEVGILPEPDDFGTQPIPPTLREAIWIARVQLFGVSMIYDEMRNKTFFPDADTFGSPNFDY